MSTLHQNEPRRWGSLTDMPPETEREASAFMRRRSIPRNVIVILPYVSTVSGERRVWRFGPDPLPRQRDGLRGVAIRLSDGKEFGGAA